MPESSAWQTTLESIKAQSQVMDVLPILEDDMAQKVLIAWPRIGISRTLPSSPLPDDTNAAWRWLWQGVEFDANELATIAGMHVQASSQKFEQIKGNHLIFPDGSMSDIAKKLLTDKTNARLRELKN